MTLPGGWAAGLLASLALSACAASIHAEGDQIKTYYVGVVEVVTPDPDANPDSKVIALSAQGLGLRIEDGLGLGYFRDQRIYVPLDCRVVIFVKNQEQLDNAVSRLGKMEGGLCVTPDLS